MPFERSVRTLLQLVKHTLKADTVTLRDSGEPRARSDTAMLLPLASPRFCLGIAWRGTRAEPDLTEISPLLEALDLILVRIEEAEKLHQFMLEATSLEWELADCKIAERSVGMLASGEADHRKVRQHVVRVLEPIAGIGAAARADKPTEGGTGRPQESHCG